jgi:pantoate--beta-alanine ligase
LDVATTIADLRGKIGEAKRQGRVVGLVPTMGALHEGHLALVRASRNVGDYTVVSIFVNPAQFGPAEDFDRYPRSLESDLAICRREGVDLVFAPSVSEMYPEGFGTWVEVQGLTDTLEGASRPGHFLGVATIVIKLFASVEPRRAYFGMKDYQQLKVIQKMVRDLNVRLDIVAVPTVREPDGLAMSSRNAYLSPEERQAATVLHKALVEAERLVKSGETSAESVRKAVEARIRTEPLASVEYVAVVHPETLEPLEAIGEGAVVLLAVRIGETRLIDNMLIGGGPA